MNLTVRIYSLFYIAFDNSFQYYFNIKYLITVNIRILHELLSMQ